MRQLSNNESKKNELDDSLLFYKLQQKAREERIQNEIIEREKIKKEKRRKEIKRKRKFGLIGILSLSGILLGSGYYSNVKIDIAKEKGVLSFTKEYGYEYTENIPSREVFEEMLNRARETIDNVFNETKGM